MGIIESLGKFCCNTICFLITLGVLLALPIAMVVMGSLYLHDCPRERFIPIYLIVMGAFGILNCLFMMKTYRNKMQGQEEQTRSKGMIALGCLISVFLIAWFIAGCYWIYHIHKDYQGDHPSLPKYCYQNLYLFAFWVQIVFIILFVLEKILTCLFNAK